MNFILPQEYDQYRYLHVSQSVVDPEQYKIMCESEWNVIKNHIKNPQKVLELGCGLGRMSIFINSMLKNNAHYILADSNGSWSGIKFGWNPVKKYYNDLNATSNFAVLNGLQNFSIFDLETNHLSDLSEIDLVISFLAVGFHFPIENYLEKLLDITTKNVTMIFGVRVGQYKIKDFNRYFNNILLLKQDGRINTKEDLLILMGKNDI